MIYILFVDYKNGIFNPLFAHFLCAFFELAVTLPEGTRGVRSRPVPPGTLDWNIYYNSSIVLALMSFGFGGICRQIATFGMFLHFGLRFKFF